MGTRCGDLDPAVVLFLQKQLNLSVQVCGLLPGVGRDSRHGAV